MVRKRRRRQTTPRRRTVKSYAGNPARKRRATRTARGLATSDEGKILIATLGMQIIAMILKNLTKTFNIKWLPPQFVVPGLIYFLARQKIIPIDGLKTVAFTKLADNFWKMLGLDYAGTYAGTYAGNDTYPQSGDYQPWARSPQQTAAALIAAQNQQYGHYKGHQQSLQTGRQLAARGYSGAEQQSLQTGRQMASRQYKN